MNWLWLLIQGLLCCIDETMLNGLHVSSIMSRGLSDEIYNSINSNDTAYGLWKDLERQMRGAEVGQRIQQTYTVWNYMAFYAKPNEKIEDSYLPFNKLINEMNRQKLKRTNIELNIQFLQSLQPKWKHFSIAIIQNQDLNKLDINNSFDLLKRNQKEVNEIRDGFVSQLHSFWYLSCPRTVQTSCRREMRNWMKKAFVVVREAAKRKLSVGNTTIFCISTLTFDTMSRRQCAGSKILVLLE
ncbi:UBN2 domain-containing protein [Artemisia annua]|uniref:UBN2 domain-containing protein n=1 Tax=Artemisia annua TaxID=35608 RepID=A0A2U1KNK5_ARTAN|nr:UBN2 domain-containing protein [Artemisia annua]